ncbi:bluetail domain-containing putative surface protein [Egbenema bharatensis]|uniref:bluetail domain-containing putative surface protein n=1 Tax=Egbenema bharatensis TaxID=3463334 RepID=UPI003A8841FF
MVLRLTEAEANQSGFVLFRNTVDSNQGLSITFDFFMYGGTSSLGGTTGGDGISFFFVDGTQLPTQSGGLGGSLGYAQNIGFQQPGLRGGYLGIGFDAFGNFSSTLGERIGGPGQRSNSIAVRGSEATAYNYLGGTESLNQIQLDNIAPGANRDNSRRTANITLDQNGNLTVSLDLNGNGRTDDPDEKVLELNIRDAGNEALPPLFRFGFAAGTGAATNIHEVDNFRVTTLDGTPIDVSFEDRLITGGVGSGGSGTTGGGAGIGSGTGGSNPARPSLVGGVGNDLLVVTPITGRPIADGGAAGLPPGSAPVGADVTGGGGADLFIFSGPNRRAALRTSTIRRLTRITDFNQREGDRIKLDFDNNLDTIERPRRFFNAGRFKGRNLNRAVRSAYADKDFRRKGNQALRPNEAVFFRMGSRSFISVNDGNRSFSPANDFLVEVTGIQVRPGDLRRGVLPAAQYFA